MEVTHCFSNPLKNTWYYQYQVFKWTQLILFPAVMFMSWWLTSLWAGITGNQCWVRSDLWVIEVGQALGSEALWQLALDGDILNLVAQQFVVNVARHGGLVHRKCLQGTLHSAATQIQMSLSLICIITESRPLQKEWICVNIFTLQMTYVADLRKITSC